MRARAKTQIVIDADAAMVFKYLSHTKYHPLWNPQMLWVKPLMQLQNGSVYTTQSVMLGVRIKAENHITGYVQDKELGIQNSTGTVQYRANFKLQAHGKGTVITCTIIVATVSKAFVFAMPIMEHLARRELRTDLQALKDAVEQKLS